ncbi:polysaccharide biosynthesis tyrosine autokinase [Phragmitibacter flavus]|uniref:Polysaccharide biosynthesis tyrosine autokinase n=1 Tax=Phragmitibacter flavus TaxID=2576071 RepID=A0A5R8KKM9_9BACT|nr:polysaccharide biosynthesis tyrosine autokinase [Phragmitibacter flavus]TLD72807.1 polysaccharide biosynthesis tyrosine autokinase [Phragmitibacter flavus]
MNPSPPQEHRQHALDYWQIIRNRLGLIFLCFLLVFAAAAVITHVMPRKYRAVVEIELKRQLKDTNVFGQLNQNNNLAGDGFLKTQLEIIQKPKTLERVVEKLKLLELWSLPANGRQFAIGRLQGHLEVNSSARSEIINITYYDEDPQLAADIANAVAESYRETRIQVDRDLADNSIKEFNIQVAAKEQLAQQARNKMFAVKKDLGIIELPGDNRATGQDVIDTVESATLIDRERDIYKLTNEIQSLRAQISQLQTLDGDALIRQAGELRVENETIRTIGPAYQGLLMRQESVAGSGLGPKHPTMISLGKEIETARTLLLDAANDYRNNLAFRITTGERQLAEAQKTYQEQRSKSLEADTNNQEYLHAKEEWEGLNRDLWKLRDTLAQQQIERDIPATPFTIHKSADEPETAPAKPNVKVNLALGAVVGLMFGFGLAFFLEYLDTTVKSIDEVERLLGVPVLAVIPKNVGALHRTTGLNPDAEAYRILRTNIEFNRKRPDANVISVVSGGSSEGKSTTMVNLATVCAQGGYNTLIIDGDLRRPRMHTFFDVTNDVGLTTYLSSPMELEEVVLETPIENLFLMPSGLMPADSSGMLNSPRFRQLLDDVKSRFDIVLIDSPPILGVSDASVLAAEADLTLLVVQHRKLPRHMLQRVKHSVDAVGGDVVGVVLNNVDIHSDNTYGYYTSYYTYYNSDQRGKKDRQPVANAPQKTLASLQSPKSEKNRTSYQDAF